SAAKPTTVLLTSVPSDYQALLQGEGKLFFNPAFFDPAKNRIVCFSDLQKLSDRRDDVRKHNKVKLEEGKDYEAELDRAYKKKVPPELLAQVEEARKHIKRTEQNNDADFKKAQRRLVERLAHEAFHAYLSNYVYPKDEGELPHWFNEGLAQI